MAEEKLTTIQIDVETRDRLKVLAVAYERTAAGQLRWLVNQAFENLPAVKMVPLDESTPIKEQGQGLAEFATLLGLILAGVVACGVPLVCFAIFVVVVVVVFGPLAGKIFPVEK